MNKNNLIDQLSPYLKQHKDNPVFWQIWSKKTLDLAKNQKKPILLSIGYSSCHWCHVMAHESFEDKATAELMNKFFINIKVDREERPDIDFVFQSSFQLFNNSGGGWPLTIFLDENAVPFMAGTYFPRQDKHGLPSFSKVLKQVSETYEKKRVEILNQKDLIKKYLEIKKNSVVNQDLEPILDSVIDNLDEVNGGFKGAPKFPTFNVFETFLYFYNKTKKEKYLKPVETLLNKICSQGIYDQVEGGISRYTVDEKWLIPHFEKMLYDNAQFISLIAKFLKVKQSNYLNKKIKQTTDFMNKNFLNQENGLLGSAFDADSDQEEGKYYIFKYEEIKNIKDIEKYFVIEKAGNWEGKIILQEKSPPPDFILKELKDIRLKRNKPFFDNKTQLDLNSIWVSSLINVYQVFKEDRYLDLAEKYYKQIETNFMKDEIFHCYSKGTVFLEDYAFLIKCLLDLYEVTLNIEYKIKAQKLSDQCIKKFFLKSKNIFQKNPIDTNDLFISPIDISDHTIPNGNSIMLSNLSRLRNLEIGKKLSNSLNGYLNLFKSHMLSSVRSIDMFKEISSGKKCTEDGCQI